MTSLPFGYSRNILPTKNPQRNFKMKKMKLGIAIIAMGALATTFASCGKDDNKDATVCSITSIVKTAQSTTTTTTIIYDEGRIATVLTNGTNGGSKLFTYGFGTIQIVSKDKAGTTLGMDDITLTPEGKVASVTKKTAAGDMKEIVAYSYDLDGNLAQYVVTNAVGAKDTTLVTYINGNMTNKKYSNNDVTSFDYYADKLFVDGDYFKITQLLENGALAVANTNLLKSSVTNNGSITTYTYQFNALNKITKMTVAGATTDEYTYVYDCR